MQDVGQALVAESLGPVPEQPAEPPAVEVAPPAPEPPTTSQAPDEPALAAVAPAAQPPAPAHSRIRDTAPVAQTAKRVEEVKASAAASAAITISDFKFAPASVTVNVGDTVTWSNAGPASHSATATGGSFDTGIFPEGESRSHTFDEAGTFSYICTPHPQMEGTVTVEAAAAQEGGASDDGTDGATEGGSSAADDAGGLLASGLITLALGALLRRPSAGAG